MLIIGVSIIISAVIIGASIPSNLIVSVHLTKYPDYKPVERAKPVVEMEVKQ